MSIYKQFGTNQDKERSGIEVKYDANDDGTIPTFIIARSGGANQKYAAVLDREMAPYRRLWENKRLSNEKAEEITVRAFCQASLLGWSHIQDKDGKEIPYSFTNALDLMAALPDLRRELEAKANSMESYRDEVIEAETKNS